MICSNCSQPALSALSHTRPSTVRVIFPVPAAGPGTAESGRKLWPGPVLPDYRWPIPRPIRSGRHWLGSDQWTNEHPGFADTDWKLGLCLGQAVERCKQGHQPLLKQSGNALNKVYNKLPKCQSLLRVKWKLNFLLHISCYCDECWNVAWNQQ